MQIKGHGNGVAIALAALAVVIAGTGTAVAVSATVVHIEDGAVAGRFADVDQSGRLSTGGATATIDSTNLASPNGDNFATSPTTATLAISKLSFSNPSANSTATNAEVRFFVYKVGVDGNGNCSLSVAPTLLGVYNIAPGDDFEENFSAPLLVKRTGSAKYCIDLLATTLVGTYTATYLPSYNLTAYVVSGSYTGTGLNAARSTPDALRKQERAVTGH